MAKKIKDQQAHFVLPAESIKPRYKVAIQPKSSKQK
jgi:ribosomal protein L7Ae-like RNA K-turn-binding protein